MYVATSPSLESEGRDGSGFRSVQVTLGHRLTRLHNFGTGAIVDHFLDGEQMHWRIVGIFCLCLEVTASLLLTFHWPEQDTGTV